MKNPIKFNSAITNSKTSLLDRSFNHSQFKIKPDKTMRIQESIEQNQILDVEPFWMDSKVEFRSRSVQKEIQPNMKYKTSNAFNSILESVDYTQRARLGLTDKDVFKK